MADSVKEQVGDIVSQTKQRVGIEQPSAADDDGRIGIVRGVWRAFGSGDHDGFVEALHEDVEWEGPDGNHFPGSGQHSGRDAVKENFVTDAGRTYVDFGFRPESFVEAEDVDSVIVVGRFEGEGREGDKVETAAVQIWEFAGNTAKRVRIFTDSAGFPEVVTERKEREWEEEDRKKEEEQKKESEGKDDSDESDGKGDSDESEGRGDSESSESKSESSSESKSESGSSSEAKSSDEIGESDSSDSDDSGSDSESGSQSS